MQCEMVISLPDNQRQANGISNREAATEKTVECTEEYIRWDVSEKSNKQSRAKLQNQQ